MPFSHCPSLGLAVFMMSADTFSSHDLAAAIAVPPANNKMFLPCSIIIFPFSFREEMRSGFTNKKSPRTAASLGWFGAC
jgi:hypothetical protein